MSDLVELGAQIGWTEAKVARERINYQREHGADGDKRLASYMQAAHQENRDEVRLLGKQGGYVESFAASLHVKGTSGEQEPEAIPAKLQAHYSDNGWQNMEVLKGEEKARREARARAERLRQAELELRQSGKSHEAHAKTIDRAIEQMKQDAAA